MDDKQLFDLVAPIAIYHGADVCFKKKAIAAWEKIVKDNLAEWPFILDCDDPDVAVWAKEKYDDLFETFVVQNKPKWKKFRDKYGAWGFRNENGEVVFTGDGQGEFPWYETIELLLKRLEWAE